MQYPIEETLRKIWGHTSFRFPQKEIITSFLEGQDVMAVLPTGAGKSVCFQLPALFFPGVTLVISPLIALMNDQIENLKKKRIPAYAIHSALKKTEILNILDHAQQGHAKILYISPERIQSDYFKERIKNIHVSALVIDEAHCISQWGFDFRPAYRNIDFLKNLFPNIPVMALTASATKPTVEDIISTLKLKNQKTYILPILRENISYTAEKCETKLDRITEILRKVNGSAILYVNSRRESSEISGVLQKKGISAAFYHAGLTEKQKISIEQRWKNNQLRLIVCTNAFGMGIDKPDVRLVIHFQPPTSLEAYYQEAGRAGRDGNRSYAVLLYAEKDFTDLRQNVEQAFPDIQTIKNHYQALANYYQMAIGSFSEMPYNFDFVEFCKKFALPGKPAYHSLKILEKNNYLVLNEGFHTPSKIHFLLDTNEIYRLQVKSIAFDKVLKALLRLYGGALYTQYVVVHENEIARQASESEFEVRKTLFTLQKLKAIDYSLRKEKPQLTFLKPRFAAEKLFIDQAALDFLKTSQLERISSVEKYVHEKNTCRQAMLAQYFDNLKNEPCGYCDICLEKKRNKKAEREHISKQFSTKLANLSPLSLSAELTPLTKYQQEILLELIRELQDQGKLILKNDLIIRSDNEV